MGIDVVRKDAPVAGTIARLHTILDRLGFRPEGAFVQRWEAGSHCHSCQVRFASYPLLYANGKGVTPDLAYTSALAEYMERLQCRADALFTRAGNIHHLAPFTAPVWRTPLEVLADTPELAVHDLRALSCVSSDPLACVPVADVFGGRLVAVPYNVLCFITGSTGMCAGNTPEEALCHGICEVFERHAIHELDTGAVRGMPTLPLDELTLESAVVQQQLSQVRAMGVDVIVKDATLGGAFPVVAVVLADRRTGTCAVSFGSDPVFDVALSRCLTEAYQGTSGLYRAIPTDRGFVRPLDTYNNLDVFFDRLLPDVGRSGVGSAFCRIASNRGALGVVVEQTRRAGRRLYVRDCSVFGFPSYFVYVEGLSALSTLQAAHFASLSRHWDDVRKTIFRLNRAAPSEIAQCSRVLFDEVTTGNPTLELKFAQQALQAPVGSWMGLRPLLALMLVEAGEPEMARTIVQWPPPSSAETSPAAFATGSQEAVAHWWPAYLEMRSGAVNPEGLRRALESFFGTPAVGVSLDESDAGPRLPVPCCQNVYCCPSCPCRRYCRLDDWFRLARRLREQAVFTGQHDVLDILNSRRSSPESGQTTGTCQSCRSPLRPD